MTDVPFEPYFVDLDDPAACEELKARIYELLGCIRIYTKAPGKPADYTAHLSPSQKGEQ